MKFENTIELVGYGHPDRFADYIAEKALTMLLKLDNRAKVALEIMVMRNQIIIGGEITANTNINKKWWSQLVKEAIDDIYIYDKKTKTRDGGLGKYKLIVNVQKQSLELNHLQQDALVAGDQGVIFGYYDQVRFKQINLLYEIITAVKNNFPYPLISADWKLLYNPRVKSLSISFCGEQTKDLKKIDDFIKSIIKKTPKYSDLVKSVLLNPGGAWLLGGPQTDTGVTGRKIMIDNFGAGVSHGGGNITGKDLSKVDKTGVIQATMIAYEISKKANHKSPVLVELNYCIGEDRPQIWFQFNNQWQKYEGQVETLEDFIANHKLLFIDWGKVLKNGGLISYFSEQFKEDNI
ncbi:MAG: hypothetical protein GQ557_02095 [Mycoplasmataceae bacterium]|nr:hypothetical protein [Mycoplasmataceae bacterium]